MEENMKKILRVIGFSFVVTFTIFTVTGCSLVSQYQGSLSGTWSDGWYSGTFSVDIDTAGEVNGTYSGDDSGNITGNVDETGYIDSQMSGGLAGTSVWTGQLESVNGQVVSGSGTYVTSDGTTGYWYSY
jgi:hypothetical protein